MRSSKPHQIKQIIDPSIQDGEVLIYKCEVILDLHEKDSDEVQKDLDVLFRIFIIENGDTLENVRIEMTTDQNIFFVYNAEFNSETFEEVKSQQNLDIEFNEFPSVLQEMFEYSSKSKRGQPNPYQISFFFGHDSTCTLSFQQKLRFKTVEIYSLNFLPASPESIQLIAQYRISSLIEEEKALKSQLADISSILKIKDPTVLRKITTSQRK